MTFPFENDNSKIIKKLARRSMAADKRRNLFAIITIALAVCLMSTLAYSTSASRTRTRNQIRGQYQSGCVNMTRQEINRLANAGKFEAYGYESPTERVKYKDSNLMVLFQNPAMLKLDHREPITGSYPQAINEIVVERAFLDYYGLPSDTGQILSFDLGDGEKEYTVSGILEKENASQMFMVFISEALIDSYGNPAPYSLKFRFEGAKTEEPEQLKADIATFFEEMGIPIEHTFYSSTYFDMTDLYLGSDMPIYAVALFVAAACSIVIYNIFYISVMGKMKEYGRMKVIGTTPKQLQKIVRKERRMISLTAIPAGLAAGALISCLLFTGYWVWGDNIKYSIIIIAITEALILISTRKPIKLAGKVSAIEAVRSTGYSGNSSHAVSKKLYRRLSSFNLARMNFSRSPKKSAITLVSLGLTGILMICIAAYGNSVDVREMARAQLGDGGDYLLFTGDLYGEELQDFQSDNSLNSSLMAELEQLPGVDHITSYSAVPVLIPQIKKDEAFNISALTREQMKERLTAEHIQNGIADYDKLLKEDGILVSRDSENLLKKLYGTDFSVGDTMVLEAFHGNEKTVTVQGIVDYVDTGNGGNFFILPEQTLHELYPETSNFTTCFNIHASQDSQKLRADIFEKVTDARVGITPLEDFVDTIAPTVKTVLQAAYGLLAFIAFFSMMNLVNTLITNMLSRQQEFGIFQSVGMSSRQLSHMLSWECLLYILGTLFITLTLGTLCSIAVCSAFSQIGTFGKLTYHFPAVQMLIFAAVLLLIQGIFSLASVQYCRKQPLVERIKTMN